MHESACGTRVQLMCDGSSTWPAVVTVHRVLASTAFALVSKRLLLINFCQMRVLWLKATKVSAPTARAIEMSRGRSIAYSYQNRFTCRPACG